MTTTEQYPQELWERAVKMVFEHQDEHFAFPCTSSPRRRAE